MSKILPQAKISHLQMEDIAAILTLSKILPQAKISHLQMEDIAALSYIAKVAGGGGGIHNKCLSDLAKEIWDYLLANGIMITKECLPKTLNVEVDHQSWSVMDSSEWKLSPRISKKIC